MKKKTRKIVIKNKKTNKVYVIHTNGNIDEALNDDFEVIKEEKNG